MTCGIYMIQNLVNGKMYIGQAVDIERRWGRHRSRLRGNNHDNEHLQSAWNKYKEDNFEFTIICECYESQLNTKEIDYISKLRTYDRDFGYNKTYGGDSERPTEETREKMSKAHKGKYCGENAPMYGKHHSEETRRKQSEANKGENAPMYGKLGAKNPKSISVVQLTLDGELVNIYGSAMEAEREGGFTNQNITACCKGRRKTHGGYRFMYLKDWLKEHNKGIPKKLYFID